MFRSDCLKDCRIASKALVPPEKALQLLSYDVHAEAYPVAREIVKDAAESGSKARGAPAAFGGCEFSACV